MDFFLLTNLYPNDIQKSQVGNNKDNFGELLVLLA